MATTASTATTATPKQSSVNIAQSGSTTDNLRLAIGAAAAASAIFAPLSYAWRGVLTAVAAESILGGIYGSTPLRKLFRF